jgi:sugar transferase EpsL
MVSRCIQLVVVVVGLIVASPLLLLLAVLVRFKLGSPVLFRQERPGMNGEPFVLAKFRTMTDQRGQDGQLLPDAERLPAFGARLRSSSLDELPELLHVLRGEMALVGPRPLLMEYVPLYTSRQARRMEVRPGITGWAQVNGRNAASWEDRLEMDVWYVDNRSVWLDVRIMFKTVRQVLRRDGIATDGHVTAPRFTGSDG